MCRATSAGGRRCPGCRGDRRRAYQRLRYATRQQPAAAKTDPPDARLETPAGGPAELETRRAASAAAVEAALVALRDPVHGHDAAVEHAYAEAVLCHGAVLRDIADARIEAAYRSHGVDDAACRAEAAALAHEIDTAGTAWRQAQAVMQHAPPLDERTARAYEQARESFDAAINDLTARLVDRSTAINAQRAQIAKDIYYEELARERAFGGASFTPANAEKLSRPDRAMFTATTSLYPDEMVERSAALGPMLAKRSKARAHYTAAALQKRRRSRAEVFDLHDALDRGYLRRSHYVESVQDMAGGVGLVRERTNVASMFVDRSPDNERRVAMMVEQWNVGRRKTAAVGYTTLTDEAGLQREVLYVKGPRVYTHYEPTGVSAELTFSDSSSMVHEMAHRVEDRNREISVATKAFLARRTAGLPSQRYARTERVVEDSFVHAYIGKDYAGTHHTELFSCGMEALTHGRFGGLRGQAEVNLAVLAGYKSTFVAPTPRSDPEHRALVLGLLASANKRTTAER
jgi:hypothetical protein